MCVLTPLHGCLGRCVFETVKLVEVLTAVSVNVPCRRAVVVARDLADAFKTRPQYEPGHEVRRGGCAVHRLPTISDVAVALHARQIVMSECHNVHTKSLGKSAKVSTGTTMCVLQQAVPLRAC